MARLNIEDSLFRDDRFLHLLEITGNRYTALGMIISAFVLAQKYWLSHGCIPKEEWPMSLNDLVQTRLASVQTNGDIYIRGSEEQFSWLTQRSAAGKVKSDKKNMQLKEARNAKKSSKNTERNLNDSERQGNGSEPLTLTLTPTLTLTQSLAPTVSLNEHKKSEQDDNRKIKQAYFNAYRLRYGIDPISNAAFNSMISNLRKKVGVEMAINLCGFYLNHPNTFYISKTHEFKFLLSDAETLRTQYLKNIPMTKDFVRELDKQNKLKIEDQKLRNLLNIENNETKFLEYDDEL